MSSHKSVAGLRVLITRPERQLEPITDTLRQLDGMVFHFSLIEIEKLNILNASLLAMKRSIKKLKSKPSLIMIDGNRLPTMSGYKLKSIIKGDQKSISIAAASIYAKCARDELMVRMDKKFNGYVHVLL